MLKRFVLFAVLMLATAQALGVNYTCPVAPEPGLGSAAALVDHVIDTDCGGGFDPARVAECGFGAKRERVKFKGSQCFDELKKILCKESMWAPLGLQERVQRVTRLAMKHATSQGVDFRAMPCLVRRESIWFEPAAMTYTTCTTSTTDQGMGQIVFSTFKDMVDNFRFVSQIPPFNQPPYTKDTKLLFEAMALSAELQMEASAAILKVKLSRAGGDYQQGFTHYNGSKEKEKYGAQVGACFECVKAKMHDGLSPDDQAKTNIDECLDKAMDGGGVDFSFTKFATECRGETFDRWDYWKGRGVDPTTRCLDPATHDFIKGCEVKR